MTSVIHECLVACAQTLQIDRVDNLQWGQEKDQKTQGPKEQAFSDNGRGLTEKRRNKVAKKTAAGWLRAGCGPFADKNMKGAG